MAQQLNSDQELFEETTAKLLAELVPVERLRSLRDDPVGFDESYWRRGAELGWTSLLVSETHGGGSIGPHGLVDLSLVASQFGRHAAPGPLAVINVVVASLSEDSGREGKWDKVINEVLSGESIATWCLAEPRPHDRLDDITLDVRFDGDEVVLNGTKRPVESGAQARYLLVTGRSGSGLTQVLIPADAPGVSMAPMQTVDLTRRFSAVTFDNVRVARSAIVGDVSSAANQYRRQVRVALAISCAESVGAMQSGFDMTVEWAFDRYSFGRPLASYQEIKHRFADMKTWLEASRAISDAATMAVATDAPNADELVSAAKAYIGHYGAELLQDCVQIHGGIGVTFDHDLHLFVRRHTVNRALYGTPQEHRQLLADFVAAEEAS